MKPKKSIAVLIAVIALSIHALRSKIIFKDDRSLLKVSKRAQLSVRTPQVSLTGCDGISRNSSLKSENGEGLGGGIAVAEDSSLVLKDVHLKGVGVQALCSPKLRLSQVVLDLKENVTTHEGGIYIDGPTTFMLHGNTWSFESTASLTVDNTVLFVQPGNEKGAFLIESLGDHLSLLNSGTIHFLTPNTHVINYVTSVHTTSTILQQAPLHNKLTDHTLVENVILDTSYHIDPSQEITVGEDITIDGGGATIIFSNPDHPQFIVAPGKKVLLKNIEFARIHAKTFNIAPTAVLEIGPNVRFELSENITFDSGLIRIVDTLNTFFMVGNAGKKIVTFVPLSSHAPCRIDLGSNTLALQNIELWGANAITASSLITDRGTVVGALGLSGNSLVNISQSTDMNFIVESVDNTIQLLLNNITLNGYVLFGNYGSNVLNFRCAFPQLTTGVPQLSFGNNCLYVTSAKGRAGVQFDDFVMNIYNEGSNSFVLGDSSFVNGHHINVVNFPIKRLSTAVDFDGNLVFTSNQSNAVDFPVTKQNFRIPAVRPITAIQVHREKEKERDAGAFEKEKQQRDQNGQTGSLSSKPQQNNTIFIDAYRTAALSENTFDLSALALHDYDAVYINTTQLANASGNILLLNANTSTNATLTNFGIDQDAPLHLTLQNGPLVSQSDNDMVLKPTDSITVVGAGKVATLVIKKNFSIQGKITLEPESTLLVKCDGKEVPVIELACKNSLVISPGARLIFQGQGIIRLQNESTIQLISDQVRTARLCVCDGSSLQLDGGATAMCFGSGNIEVSNGGAIEVLQGGHLIVGQSPTDALSFKVQQLGAIKLRVPVNAPLSVTSKISFIHALFDLCFQQGGILSVGDQCIFEVNVLSHKKSEPCPGYLRKFVFESNGTLNIDAGGMLLIGRNVFDQHGPNAGYEKVFEWSSLGGSLIGSGLVQFAGSTFTGRLSSRLFIDQAMTAERLVSALVQTLPQLTQSTVFYDKEGARVLRTKGGVFIPLHKDDKVVSDTIEGVVNLYNKNAFGLYSFNAQGIRVT